MPESCATVKITYTPDPRIKPVPGNAKDLHIDAVNQKGDVAGQLDLIGVGGVGPRDPKATYNVEGSGTGSIDITGIDVRSGNDIEVRLCSPTVKMPRMRAKWSTGKDKDGFIFVKEEFLTFAMLDVPQVPSEPVSSDGEPVEFREVLQKISKLAEHALGNWPE